MLAQDQLKYLQYPYLGGLVYPHRKNANTNYLQYPYLFGLINFAYQEPSSHAFSKVHGVATTAIGKVHNVLLSNISKIHGV